MRIPEFKAIILEVFNVMQGNLDYSLGNREYGSVVHRFQEADNGRMDEQVDNKATKPICLY